MMIGDEFYAFNLKFRKQTATFKKDQEVDEGGNLLIVPLQYLFQDCGIPSRYILIECSVKQISFLL